MRQRSKLLIVAALSFLIILGFVAFWPKSMTWVTHTGKIAFFADNLAADDTTNPDATGTLDLFTPGSKTTLEPAQVLGTDTQTDYPYTSGQIIRFAWKSTVANVWDIAVIDVELPFADALVTSLYNLAWNPGNPGNWIVTCHLAREDTPKLLGYMLNGTVWPAAGTRAYDMSDNNYAIFGVLRISVGLNFAGIIDFFDPEENQNGMQDGLWITATTNTTGANIAFAVPGWTNTNDGAGWFHHVDLPNQLGGTSYLFRWDSHAMYGVLEIPFSVTGSVLDSANPTYATRITFTLRECQDITDCQQKTYDSDTLTNFVSAPTVETVDIGI